MITTKAMPNDIKAAIQLGVQYTTDNTYKQHIYIYGDFCFIIKMTPRN